MKRLILAGMLLSGVSTAFAGPYGGSGYVTGIGLANFAETSDYDVSFPAVVASVGYKQQVGQFTYLIPELRVGLGVGSKTVQVSGVDADLEMDVLTALSLKGQLDLTEAVYVFLAPTFASTQVSATVEDEVVSATDWGVALGAGVGIQFGYQASLEFGYEKFNNANILSLGMKFNL